MTTRKAVLVILTVIFASLTINAQLFETRSTRFSGQTILTKLQQSGSATQVKIRDSIIESLQGSLNFNEIIETFFDDYHMGLVVYKDARPHELIGFWNPDGKSINGGYLSAGNGTIKTPFNPKLIQNFASESIVYESGMKNGPVFYYCDCASVLRKGQFNNNQKEGLWKEFTPAGAFIKQKQMKIVVEPDEIIQPDNIDWLKQAHCMMRNPDEKIICPNL